MMMTMMTMMMMLMMMMMENYDDFCGGDNDECWEPTHGGWG